MKGILIDAEKKQVREVEFDYSLDNIYHLVGCTCIDYQKHGEHNLIIDDEGLLKPQEHFFSFDGQKFAGNGLVLGEEELEDGDYDFASTRATAEEIAPRVRFYDADELTAEEKEPHFEVIGFDDVEAFLKALERMQNQ